MNNFHKKLHKIISTLEKTKDALMEIECEDGEEDCSNIGMAIDDIQNAIVNIYEIIE